MLLSLLRGPLVAAPRRHGVIFLQRGPFQIVSSLHPLPVPSSLSSHFTPSTTRSIRQLFTSCLRKCRLKFPPPAGTKSNNWSLLFAPSLLGCLGAYSVFAFHGKRAFCEAAAENRQQNRVQAFRDAQNESDVRRSAGGGGGGGTFDWRLFWQFLRPDLLLLLGAIACSVCLAVVNTQIPLLLGKLVNVIAQVAPKRSADYFGLVRDPVSKLCLTYLLHAGLTFVNIALLATVGERLAARLRLALFSNLLRQEIAFFDTRKTGELINRLSIDVQEFKHNFKACFVNGFKTLIQTVGGMYTLYNISPNMTCMLMIGLPTLVGIGGVLASGLRQLSRAAQAQVAHATDVAEEAVSQIRTVRAFAAEEPENRLYKDEVQRSMQLNEYLGCSIGVFQSLSNLVFNGAILAVIYAGGSYMAEGKMQPGDLMSFMVTSQAIQKSLASLSMLFGQAVSGISSGTRVFEFIKLEPGMRIKGGLKIPYHELIGNIRFKGVHFSYPSRPEHTVLAGLDFTIPAGQVVALCGPSGSGKSTVAALLEHFYEPSEGQITLDGKDIRHLDPSWLRGRVIGYISQEPTLFATSVIENIRYGRPDATDAEVIEAAQAANADEFISAFPNGYQTVLGERGVTVSGGQKQRIAIARALLKNPSILILDEATSALDSESEKFVQEALDRAAKGRTVLVIAHRLSTIQNANAIALMVNGQIAEIGDHASLMKQRGLYWQFVQHQARSSSSRATA